MLKDETPLFLTNRNWYITPEDEGIDWIFFDDGRGYHIKDDAPEEVKKSYYDWYAKETDLQGRESV